MGGDAYNAHYVQATREQAMAQIKSAETQGRYDYKVAREQSQAVIQQSKYDYEARLYEAKLNAQVQFEALRVREKEANLQHKVEWKQALNDSIKSEAMMVNAMANKDKYEVKAYEAESKRARDEMRYGDEGGGGYWYG